MADQNDLSLISGVGIVVASGVIKALVSYYQVIQYLHIRRKEDSLWAI